MNFFKSDIVRSEMAEIAELQEVFIIMSLSFI
jgi:hypothetical protein